MSLWQWFDTILLQCFSVRIFLIMFLILVYFFFQHLFGEDKIFSSPTASPSYLPVSSNLEDPDYATNKMERPSPVSVLEPLFTDDDISPASTISQPG